MFRLAFTLNNPFRDTNVPTTDLVMKHWMVSRNKSVDINVDFRRNLDPLLYFDINVTRKRSHAGVFVGLAILGLTTTFEFYDIRHWNDVQGGWDSYPEPVETESLGDDVELPKAPKSLNITVVSTPDGELDYIVNRKK